MKAVGANECWLRRGRRRVKGQEVEALESFIEDAIVSMQGVPGVYDRAMARQYP